jgi:uncharacterized protein (DUF433 family)
MTTTTNSRYVTRHPDILSGKPIIKGTRTAVRAIVENWRLGIRPEEIPLHLPHLTLAQVKETRCLRRATPTRIIVSKFN